MQAEDGEKQEYVNEERGNICKVIERVQKGGDKLFKAYPKLFKISLPLWAVSDLSGLKTLTTLSAFNFNFPRASSKSLLI